MTYDRCAFCTNCGNQYEFPHEIEGQYHPCPLCGASILMRGNPEMVRAMGAAKWTKGVPMYPAMVDQTNEMLSTLQTKSLEETVEITRRDGGGILGFLNRSWWRFQCKDGCDKDEMPNGHGEFGFAATNPVPTNTPMGSYEYLARLRTLDGLPIAYAYIGAATTPVSPHPVDCYALSNPDGECLGNLFISAYQKRNSRKPPGGFKLAT